MKYKYVKPTNVTRNYLTDDSYPTRVTEYECFCKNGKIVEMNTSGFDDHFITLECNNCLKKYKSFIDICGFEWKVPKQYN